MSIQLQAQIKPVSAPSFTPVQIGLQRKCASNGCAERRKKRLTLQRSSTNQAAEPSEVPPIVHDVLRSPGQPLDTLTRAFMESRFGYDFGKVRVHIDAKAAESARAMNALAYTVGRDMVFGAGQYAPTTAIGHKLLVHELVHVRQQGAGNQRIQGRLEITNPKDAVEQEAEAAASAFVKQQIIIPIHAHTVQIARQNDKDAGEPASPQTPLQRVLYLLQHPQAGPVAGVVVDFPEIFRILNGLAMFDILPTLTELRGKGYLDELKSSTDVNRDRVKVAIMAVEFEGTYEEFASKQGSLLQTLPEGQKEDIKRYLSAIPAPVRSEKPKQPTKAEKEPKLLQDFASKFSDAADLIRKSEEAMRLVREAEAAGAKFGGYAEEGPGKNAWAYTIGNTVYVPKARTDKVLAMNSFLFELNNAVRAPKFAELGKEAAAGTKGKLTAKEYAYKMVEQEVEGLLRIGELWFEMKKTIGKGAEWNKYDNDFYLSDYTAFKEGKKTKDKIVKDVLDRKYTSGKNAGKTVEQYYMEEYNRFSGGK